MGNIKFQRLHSCSLPVRPVLILGHYHATSGILLAMISQLRGAVKTMQAFHVSRSYLIDLESERSTWPHIVIVSAAKNDNVACCLYSTRYPPDSLQKMLSPLKHGVSEKLSSVLDAVMLGWYSYP